MTGVNRAPVPMAPAEGRARVEVLNVLAESLDEAATGSVGVRFAAREDGSGLYCVAGAENDPGDVGALCHGFAGPTAPSAEVRARVRAAPDPNRPEPKAKAGKRSKASKTRKLIKAGKSRGKPAK